MNALIVAVPLGLLIGAVLFGKSKPTWHPFAGMFKHDRKTGQLTVAMTLPGRKSKRRKRKR